MTPQPYPLWITAGARPLLVVGWVDRGDLGIQPVVIDEGRAEVLDEGFTVLHPGAPDA